MPSNNVLLGENKIEEVKVEGIRIEKRAPAWRYHINFPQGKIFYTDVELDKADADGWVDHPGKVGKVQVVVPEPEAVVLAPETVVKIEPETVSKIDVSGKPKRKKKWLSQT